MFLINMTIQQQNQTYKTEFFATKQYIKILYN